MPSAAQPADLPAPGWEAVVDSIGPKVHALRRERGLTLQQLAHLADVSTATVHKVERSDMVPTVTTLLKLATALDAPIRHFVETGDAGSLHTRFAGADTAPLTPDDPATRLRGVATRIGPGEETGARRAGETLLVVLDGTVELQAGETRYTVAGGEALHLRSATGLRGANPGDAPAEVVWVTLAED
jgi:transcriptional regulator with XRE-family HTH domain